MKLTNRLNLPTAVMAALANDPYDRGDSQLTASSLANPPQQRVLLAKHGDELTEDAAERFWALDGQAWHAILERAGKAVPNVLTEQRLFSEFAGWRVSGQFDLLTLDGDAGLLTDYKSTSAWTLVYKSRLPEWEAQLNALAELCERNGHPVGAIQVMARLRDWSATDARKSADYPQAMVAIVPLRLWPQAERVAWIEQRVRLHQAAERGDIPPCTDEERWAKPTKWALMKRGRKSAIKLYESEGDAILAAAQQDQRAGAGHSIEKRPGGFARCEGYCAAAPVCPQWQAERPPATLEEQLVASIAAEGGEA